MPVIDTLKTGLADLDTRMQRALKSMNRVDAALAGHERIRQIESNISLSTLGHIKPISFRINPTQFRVKTLPDVHSYTRRPEVTLKQIAEAQR